MINVYVRWNALEAIWAEAMWTLNGNSSGAKKKNLTIEIIDNVMWTIKVAYSKENAGEAEISLYLRTGSSTDALLIQHGIAENGVVSSAESITALQQTEMLMPSLNLAEGINAYIQEKMLPEEYEGLDDNEHAGILFETDESGELTATVVEGRQRPDLFCWMPSGEGEMKRPYETREDGSVAAASEDPFEDGGSLVKIDLPETIEETIDHGRNGMINAYVSYNMLNTIGFWGVVNGTYSGAKKNLTIEIIDMVKLAANVVYSGENAEKAEITMYRRDESSANMCLSYLGTAEITGYDVAVSVKNIKETDDEAVISGCMKFFLRVAEGINAYIQEKMLPEEYEGLEDNENAGILFETDESGELTATVVEGRQRKGWKDEEKKKMNRPNFFCDINSLFCLMGKEFEGGGYKDIALTMDLIELPYFFIFTADEENVTVKAMRRDEIYSHDDSGVEIGSIVLNKESGKVKVEVAKEEVAEKEAAEGIASIMIAVFGACQKLSCFMQENKIDELAADFDPELEGIMLYMEGDELKYKLVSGKERPDMMVRTLLGEPTMGRPYMDESLAKIVLDGMSFEEKIEAAKEGDKDAMNAVAMAYTDGDEDDDIEADPVKALYWWEKSAEEGNAAAAFNVGLFYAKGYGTERNLEKAAEWMERAAAGGDKDAEAIAPIYRQAIKDLTLAEGGNAEAQGRLAGFYMGLANSLEQSGTGDYYAESLKWAKLAAGQNYGEGFWTLALAYEHGRGVEKNVGTAIEYYERGAEAGHARSLNSLGAYYLRGDVVDKNMKLGYELILRASLLGDGEAMQNMGRCYQFGYGCMGNMKKAIFWYKKSLELIPNEELQKKVAFFESFESLNVLSGVEDYEGTDSDRELTSEEQAFVKKIDAILPKDVKEKAENPDVVFVDASFESNKINDSGDEKDGG